MLVNKRITYFLITGLFVFSILHTSMMVKADLPFANNTNWKWAVNSGDHLIYHVEDNVLGSRYEAFNVSGNPWAYAGFLDVLNLTRFKYNPETYLVEETDALFQCAVSLAPGFWQLSFYDELGQNTGDFIFAFPLVPVDALTGNLDLNTWAAAMTSNVYGGTSYAGSLNLTEYHVVGNEIQLYNSTTGHYVNMTYDNNGHLQLAKISLVLDMGGPYNIIQTITAFSGDLNILNPIDNTALNVEVDDMLIYEQKIMGMESYYLGYNITWKGITTEPYPGGIQVFIGANATRYHWNPYINDWMVEEDEWDEENEEWNYAFIDQSVGGGNDFYQFRRMDGPFSLVYPIGTNGSHLYNNYAAIFAQPENGGLDQYIVTEWSLRLYNSAGDYYYLEMNGSSGILKNGTFSVGGMVYTNYLSTADDLPEPIGSDEVVWHTNVGDVKYYEMLNYITETPNHFYQKVVINNIYSRIVQVEMYGTLIPMNVSVINATLYHLDENTNDWIETPIDEEDPNYEYENVWGIGNDEGPIHIGGEPARLYQDGVNGDRIYGIYYPYGLYFGMDYFTHSPNYFEMNNGSLTGTDIYLVIEIDPVTGWVNHQKLRLPNEAVEPGEPTFHQMERWLINEGDLPYNELPSAPQALTAIAGNAVVTLTWTVPMNEGGSAITGYTIYRTTSETGTYIQIGTTSSTVLTFTDSSVVNGITYYYKVSANNTVGESPLSGAESATPTAPITTTSTTSGTTSSTTETTPFNIHGYGFPVFFLTFVISVVVLMKRRKSI